MSARVVERTESEGGLKPKAIVFDLWFTLITPEDFQQPYVSSAKRIPEVLGLDTERFAEYWDSCLPVQYRDPRPPVEYAADYLAKLGRTMTDSERSSFDSIWGAHDRALSSPRSEVLAALHELAGAGARLGLLSNAHEREIRGWSSSPLANLFDEACFSCHLGHVKPQPEAYSAILDALGVPGSEAAFVGDGASGELEGARRAGIRWTVWMRGFYDAWKLPEATTQGYLQQADFAVKQLGDLRSVFGESSRA